MALAAVNVYPIYAQSNSDDRVEKIKTDVRKRAGDYSKVIVTMNDGTKRSGHIGNIREDSFDLIDPRMKRPATILYRDVAELKKHDDWSTGKKVALGVGIGAAIVAGVVLGAIGKKGGRRGIIGPIF